MRSLLLILCLGLACPAVAQVDYRNTALYEWIESGDLGRENIRRIQRILARIGYRPGVADGIYGERTREAIAAWQRDTGQPVHGLGLAPGAGPAGMAPAVGRAICGDGLVLRTRGAFRTTGTCR